MTGPADLHNLLKLLPEEVVTRVFDALDRAAAERDPRLLDELADLAEDAAGVGLPELARLAVAGLIAVWQGQDPREMRGMVLPDDLRERDPLEDALDVVLGSAQAIPVATRLLGVVARLAERRGDTDRAVGMLSRAVAENELIGQDLWAAIHRQSLGAVLARAGRIRDADVQSQLAQRTYERLDDQARIAAVLLNQAQNALTVDEFDRAEELLDRAETFVAADETRHLALSAAHLRAMTLLQRGDVDTAERALRSVIATSRRARDLPMQRVATQNLATLLSNDQRPGRALPWFDRALDLAQREGDPEVITALSRIRARNLARLGRHDEAVEALRDVLASETGPHAGPSRARTMSDLAAALLMRATGQRDRSNTRAGDLAAARPGRDADLAEADQLLRGAVLEQLATHDERGWLDQTLANLVVLRRLQDRTAEAAAELVEWAGRTSDDEQGRALLEEAARLLIEIDDIEGAVELFRRAAASGGGDHSEAMAQVQSLVLAASELDQGGHQEAALAFYQDAAAVLDRHSGDAPFRNDIRNDTAIVLAELGRRDEARELLVANVSTARFDQNRVELAKSLANLGEVNRRDDRFEEAVGQLAEAAGLYEEVGEYAVAADTWALLCNTYVLLGRRDDARSAARAAEAAAEREPTLLAEGRALDARALAQSLDGNHAVAADLAFRAARSQEGIHRLESLAYAAEEYARAGNWPRFRRILDRLSAGALADPALTGQGGLLLVRPARVWLVAGYPRRAARALAYCLALALSAAAKLPEVSGPDSAKGPANEQFLRAFGLVAEALTTVDADPSDQRRCRVEVLRQVERTAPGASQITDELLEQAEEAMLKATRRPADQLGLGGLLD